MVKIKIFLFVTLTLFISFLVTPGIAYADDANGNLELDINGYHVRLSFSAPSHVGKNEFHIYLQDLDHSPLSSARVNLVAAPVPLTDENVTSLEKNPALAGHYILHSIQVLPTPASANPIDWSGNQAADPNSEIKIEHPADHIVLSLNPGQNAGEYTGVVSFPQAGRWVLFIDFNARGKTQFVQFPLQIADKSGSPLGIFFGLLAAGALLVYGVILIRRKAQ
jgi:hypothetical protein